MITKTALADELGISRSVLDRHIRELTGDKSNSLRKPRPRKPLSQNLADAIRALYVREDLDPPLERPTFVKNAPGQIKVRVIDLDSEYYGMELPVDHPAHNGSVVVLEDEELPGGLIGERLRRFRKESPDLAEFPPGGNRIGDIENFIDVYPHNGPSEELLTRAREAIDAPVIVPAKPEQLSKTEVEPDPEPEKTNPLKGVTIEPDPDDKLVKDFGDLVEQDWETQWRERQAKEKADREAKKEEKVAQIEPGKAVHPLFTQGLDITSAVVLILVDAISCGWIAWNSFEGSFAYAGTGLFFFGGMAAAYGAIRIIGTMDDRLAEDWSNGLLVYQILLHGCALEVFGIYSFPAGKMVIAIGFAMSMKVLAKSFRTYQ